MTTLLAVRTTRSQARQSEDLGFIALLIAILVALWTYRSERNMKRREERVTSASLEDALGG